MGAVDFLDPASPWPKGGGIAFLSPKEALAFMSEGTLLVDLREAYETNFRVFDAGDVCYLPMSKFRMDHAALPKNRSLIIADAAGIYGKEAAETLVGEGRSSVAVLVGGMIDWDAEGLPVRKDREYELGGQCGCKIKPRKGGNPLLKKE
ncbi:MAG TPA: hypothetical protein VN445_09920 [Rectinemataceae bacterium]|nr:hypothetical protein [Rectinemataceae bacterium]